MENIHMFKCTDLEADFACDGQPITSSHLKTNPNSLGRTIWKRLARLGTLGYLPKSLGTAAWLKNIVLKALDYLTSLGKGTWLKSVVLKECLTIPDYLLDHPVWIHLVVPTANWESNHSPKGI
jgi:hypothetical protein